MTPDQLSLETELREFQAAVLDEALLLRLEAAADGTLTQLSHEEIRFEAFLRGTSPARLSPDFLAQLEAIVLEVPFAVDEKIVLFPKANTSIHVRRQRPIWAAAAAVALIGAASALLVPSGRAPATVARQNTPASPPPVTRATGGNLMPATFNRGLSEVHDEGVVWKSNNQPHSLVRVVYKDKITVTKDGRTYQVEQPRVEYMLVPAKTN